MPDLLRSLTAKPIVVIDDDSEDLDLTRELAKMLAIPNEVLAFTDPVAALAFLTETKEPPLLIICDVNMPRLDGFQLRVELLEKVAAIEKVPFFFMSTSRSPGEIRLSEEFKATGYYQKANFFDEQKGILQNMWLIAKEVWNGL